MTVIVDVNPDEEAWIAEQAAQQGVPPAEVIKKLIDAQMPVEAEALEADDADPTAALFAQWAREDVCRSPDKVAAVDMLWREFEQGINATRRELGMREL